MKTTPRVLELSRAVSARYGLKGLDCDGWNELNLFGGVAMERKTFSALAEAGIERGDTTVIVYELETAKVEFEPASIDLQFESFKHLGDSIMSHFDLVMIPVSRRWAAILTNELETIVCGSSRFLADVARSVPLEFLSNGTSRSDTFPEDP